MKKLLVIISILFIAQTAQAACVLKSGNLYVCLSTDANPVASEGTRRYNSDNKKLFAYLGGSWNEITDPAKQVTGGDTHDHTLGAGAQIKHSELSEIGTNTHPEIDTGLVRVDWLDQADTDRFCSGVVAGGTITPTSGNLFTIAAGNGYINDHTTGKSHVVWTEKTGVATIGNGSNYIAIDADGNANVSLTKQAQGSYVRLGHVYAASGNTVILETWNVPDWAIHLQGRLNDFVGEGIGVLVDGSTVSEKTTPNFLELNIASGTMRDRLGTFTLGSTSTFSSLYHTSDYDWVPDTATPNHVNTTQYNNYSGTYGGTALVTMTDTYWKKDIVVRVPSGNVYYIMAQTQYATEDEAKTAAIPVLPPSVSDDTAKIATIISQKNDTTIATGIYDVRPNIDRIMGYGTGGAATDHATLTHLLFSESGHYGTLDGDWLPGLSATKKGGVPATGTPSGKYLKDDGTWATVSGGGYATIQDEGTGLTQRTILNFTGTGATCADDTTRTTCTINAGGVDLSAEPFVTASTSTNLSAERVLMNGTNTTVDTGTAGQIKINVPAIPTDISGASYWTKVAETNLSNEIALGGLGSGLILNTTTTGVPTIYGGTSCTNQFTRSLSVSGAATCAGIGVADFTANQGTTTQVLHGNAAGQPSWGGVSLTNDAAANQGSTTTFLKGNAAGQPTWASPDLGTDVTGTLLYTRGGSGQTTAPDDNMLIGNGTAWQLKALPAGGTDGCSGSTDKPIYTASTNLWSCGTDAGAAGAGPVSIVKLAADHAISSTTPTKVSMDKALTAGTYAFRYDIQYQSATLTVGVKFGVNYTGTVTSIVWRQCWTDLAGTATAANPDQDSILAAAVVMGCFASRAVSTTGRGVLLSVDTINANMYTTIEGLITVSTSGNLELYHGSETATSTTVKAGTLLTVTAGQ